MALAKPRTSHPGPGIAEWQRLEEDARRERHWKRWGPYLSERAWGTVREDYSPYGNFSRTTMRGRKPIGGTRTAWPVSATGIR